MNSPLKAQGFTLIEVLVALVILGLTLSTGFRIVSSSVDRLRIERDAVELATYAEAAWYALKLERVREPQGLSLAFPATFEIDVVHLPIEGVEFDGWSAIGDLDWVTLTVRKGDQAMTLEGVMPAIRE